MDKKYQKIYPWVVVGLLWVVALLNYMDRQMLSTMKNAMMHDISELDSAERFGQLMAIFLWIYGIASPFAGLIADRLSRKWLIVGSLAVWSGVTLTMGYANTFNQLYVLRAIMGISEALYIPASMALIADYHKGTTRSLAIGIHITGLYFGQGLGGFGATVAHLLSWQQTFHFFGLTGVIYSMVLIFLLREKTDSRQDIQSQTFTESLKSIKHSLAMLWGTISFWIILFYFAAPGFPSWAVKNWVPTLFAESLKIDMSVSGPLSTITISASAFLGVIAGGIISDRWIKYNLRGRIYTGAIGLSFCIPALILLGFSHGVNGIMLGAILFGIGFGMYDSNNMPILCQFVSPRHRAAGYGFMNMIGVFCGALITKVLGRSTDSGHLGRDMALLSIAVVLAVGLQLTMLKPKVADKISD